MTVIGVQNQRNIMAHNYLSNQELCNIRSVEVRPVSLAAYAPRIRAAIIRPYSENNPQPIGLRSLFSRLQAAFDRAELRLSSNMLVLPAWVRS